MKCVICKHGDTAPGSTTVTLERGPCTLVVKSVPADVCQTCGEEYLSRETTRALQNQAAEAAAAGSSTQIREFGAA